MLAMEDFNLKEAQEARRARVVLDNVARVRQTAGPVEAKNMAKKRLWHIAPYSEKSLRFKVSKLALSVSNLTFGSTE